MDDSEVRFSLIEMDIPARRSDAVDSRREWQLTVRVVYPDAHETESEVIYSITLADTATGMFVRPIDQPQLLESERIRLTPDDADEVGTNSPDVIIEVERSRAHHLR